MNMENISTHRINSSYELKQMENLFGPSTIASKISKNKF